MEGKGEGKGREMWEGKGSGGGRKGRASVEGNVKKEANVYVCGGEHGRSVYPSAARWQ